MKAVRLLEYGGQLVFDEAPTPTIARDEILVKIRSTAVNHLDLVKASGAARQILPIDLPWIPGHEYSGVVEQIGSDVVEWAPGDAVFGAGGMGGAYAEYLAVKPAAIARKPSNLSFEEAASVPVASQTAWQGIVTHAHLEKGQTILIHGGAGAVGAYAVHWYRMPAPPLLPLRAATMRRTSTPSEPAGLSIIERRSLRRFCEKRSMWCST
jgi:NADPH:quinone reductase-like Zn-dependent oxidoreductase